MTYLFWFPTKTINFFGCSWLIDIKSVRGISYSFCLKSNGLYLTDSTFLDSSQLTTNIHWVCYCTDHFYVVIHFCDSMLSFWVEANCAGFLYCRWRFSYQEGRRWDPINRFNPTTLLCLSQTRTWITNVLCRGIFVFSERILFVLLILLDFMTITV